MLKDLHELHAKYYKRLLYYKGMPCILDERGSNQMLSGFFSVRRICKEMPTDASIWPIKKWLFFHYFCRFLGRSQRWPLQKPALKKAPQIPSISPHHSHHPVLDLKEAQDLQASVDPLPCHLATHEGWPFEFQHAVELHGLPRGHRNPPGIHRINRWVGVDRWVDVGGVISPQGVVGWFWTEKRLGDRSRMESGI